MCVYQLIKSETAVTTEANTGIASTCRADRRKTKKEREVAIIAVLAEVRLVVERGLHSCVLCA
jgi:hypothetical protein